MINNHCRLAYAEIHPDEKGTTCAGVLTGPPRSMPTTTPLSSRVLRDHAKTHRPLVAFRAAPAELGIPPNFIKPHCPRTNGKAERLNRTLAAEWAHARPYTNQDRAKHCRFGRTNTTGNGPTPASAAYAPSTARTMSRISTPSAYASSTRQGHLPPRPKQIRMTKRERGRRRQFRCQRSALTARPGTTAADLCFVAAQSTRTEASARISAVRRPTATDTTIHGTRGSRRLSVSIRNGPKR